jgi:hypothetical protein
MKKFLYATQLCSCINQHLLTPGQHCELCGGMVPMPGQEEHQEPTYTAAYFEALEDQLCQQGYAAA